jgi:hypothetical protein
MEIRLPFHASHPILRWILGAVLPKRTENMEEYSLQTIKSGSKTVWKLKYNAFEDIQDGPRVEAIP